jgi:hypothetical protein
MLIALFHRPPSYDNNDFLENFRVNLVLMDCHYLTNIWDHYSPALPPTEPTT